MTELLLSALILLNTSAFSKPARMEQFQTRAAREGWTFKFSDHRRMHSTGLKKKFILSSERKRFRDNKIEVPNSFDLRPNISPIQDQGQCGSCWAHSLTATLADGYWIAGNTTPDLSPQYLVDCAANADGCQGGYFDAALYLVFPKGSPTRADYNYVGQDGICQNKPTTADIASYHMLGDHNGPTIQDIEGYMSKYGRPVSVTVAAGAGAWQNYDSGVYNGCTMAPPDHMINIVGWDNEGTTFDSSGNLPPGKGIWILRNSWGKSWGEKGWMRTKMTDLQGERCNNIAEEAAYFDFDFNRVDVDGKADMSRIDYLVAGAVFLLAAVIIWVTL